MLQEHSYYLMYVCFQFYICLPFDFHLTQAHLASIVPIRPIRQQKTKNAILDYYVDIISARAKKDISNDIQTDRSVVTASHLPTPPLTFASTASTSSVPRSPSPLGSPHDNDIDTKSYYRTTMKGKYLSGVECGGFIYKAYCLAKNPYPEVNLDQIDVFEKEVRELERCVEQGFEEKGLTSYEDMIFFIKHKNGICMLVRIN